MVKKRGGGGGMKNNKKQAASARGEASKYALLLTRGGPRSKWRNHSQTIAKRRWPAARFLWAVVGALAAARARPRRRCLLLEAAMISQPARAPPAAMAACIIMHWCVPVAIMAAAACAHDR